MTQRSKTRGEPTKARGGKTVTLDDRKAPKVRRNRSSSVDDKEKKIAQLTRERDEALERQTTTANVLKLINRSTFDLQTVLDTLTQTAARLCGADTGSINQRIGDAYWVVSSCGYSSDAIKHFAEHPLPVDRNSLTGRTVAQGKVIHLPDVLADPEYGATGWQHAAGYRTVLGVPMLRDGAIIGILAFARNEVNAFTDREIELVRTFADQAVIAIENARLVNELRQRTTDLTESLEQQTATSEVLQVIGSSPGDLQPIFSKMLENAVRICDAKFGNVYRWEDEVGHLVATHKTPPAFAQERRRAPFRATHTVNGRMLATKSVVHIPDVSAVPELDQDTMAYRAAVQLGNVKTVLAVPMVLDNTVIGSFGLYRTEVRPFTEKQIGLVTSFAAQAVIAIENSRLLSELRQRTDDLSKRTTDLTESLEQQTATAKVLEVISRSAFELKAVFEAVVESSVRLCGAERGVIYRFDGETLRIASSCNAPPQLIEWIEKHPFRPGKDRTSGRATARAALERRTVHIPDVNADPAYASGSIAIESGRTFLAVPILKGDALLGVITIYHLEVRPFTDKQISLVETFADQAAIAIENVRLLDELRQRTDELGRSVDELRALGEVSQAVNSTLELETVLSTIVAKAVQLSNTDAGAIYVFDDSQREFHLRATYAMDQELIDALSKQRIVVDESNVAIALAQREPTQIADLSKEAPNEINEITLRAGYHARLTAPLFRGVEIIGLLVVRRHAPGAFPQNTVDLIKTFAAQSVLAIQNARLFDNVETRTRELAKSLGDLRIAQDRLVQTEKLASLGQLTAGIAHEIKNPLNFVNNFSAVSIELIDELRELLAGVHLDNTLRTEISEIADTLQGNLGKVVQHGKRADSIVKNMLLHSRQGTGEHRLVDINALVEESLNLAYHGARAEKEGFNITLEKSFDPTAGEVDLFPQEITRVLLNLISNGFYAATKRKAEVDKGGYEPTLTAATANLGDYVEIRIRDNGAGIAPEVREKLFNPFFTTKPAGEGTGLGLSISHDIVVKQHSGSIEVDTRPDEFTEFRIVLPRSAPSANKSGGRP